MPEAPDVSGAVRDHLALALDVDDAVAAERLARELRPWFGVVKVGLELFSATGPEVVQPMIEQGYKVFLDLKLADIPNTVNRAARVLGALGVSYLTLHTSLGEATLRAGVEGLAEGAARAGLAAPVALGVTVLTSEGHAPPELMAERVTAARLAGCGGVVCAATDLAVVKREAPGLLCVVPGIRPAGAASNDQARTATPASARQAGADLLVIGRAVTSAPDRQAAAAAVAAELEGIHIEKVPPSPQAR